MTKKVLIIQPFLSYGGAEAVSIGIAKYLRHKKYDSKLIALFIKKNNIKDIDKIDLVLAPKSWSKILYTNKLLFYLFGFPMLFYLVWRESRNAILLNPHNFPTLWVAVVIGKIKNIPVIWTVHNFPQSRLDFLNILFAKYCKKIIAVSPKVKRQIREKYNLHAEVSYPTIDFEFFSKGKKINKYKTTTALLVSRITEDKNIDLAIRAVKNKRIDLLIAGEGNLNLSLPKNVKFLGYKNSNELRDLYASVDFLILPSYKTEGFNLVPFEAGCTDTPSIVMKGSGADEVIEANNLGFVTKPNTQSISKKIDLMMKKYNKFKTKNWIKNNLSENNYNKYA